MVTEVGRVIWITGLSGAGKTTLARALQASLPGSILLDGDELRQALGSADKGFDQDSRLHLASSYSRLAALLARQGFTVIVATISLFHEIHAWNRENMPCYLEIFLDVPFEVRASRDPKGLYAKDAQSDTSSMAGSGIKAEFPFEPHLQLKEYSVSEAVRRILALIA